MKDTSAFKRVILTLSLCFLLWAASWLWPATSKQDAFSPNTVLVQLTDWEGQSNVPLEINGDWSVLSDAGDIILSGTHFHGSLSLDAAGANIGAWAVPLHSFTIRPRGNHALRIGDRWFDGLLIVKLNSSPETRLPSAFDIQLELNLEDYVLGVLCGEMATSATGTQQALQAQAVASRTYALWRLSQGRGFLRDNTKDQRFLGSDYHTKAARQAVDATRGLVLTWRDKLLPAYFHADCAGHTVDAFEVDFVNRPTPPLSGVVDPSCAARGQWSDTIPASTLDSIASNRGIGEWVQRIEAARRDGAGRWMQTRLSGNQGMRILNADHLRTTFSTPSACWTDAEVRPDGSFALRGRGYGHGVGLCQRGARDLARAGQSHLDILSHYYPGAKTQPWLGLSPTQ